MLRARQKDETERAFKKECSREQWQRVVDLCESIRRRYEMISDNNFSPNFIGHEKEREKENQHWKEEIRVLKGRLKFLGYPAHAMFRNKVIATSNYH